MASKTGYHKNRIWNSTLCSQLTNKLTINWKSFLSVSISFHDWLILEERVRPWVILTLLRKRWNLYINRSFLPFSFVSFFPYATTCLPACLPALVSRFVCLFRFYISSSVLVAILLYIHTYISVPALVLPKRATLHLDPFVTGEVWSAWHWGACMWSVGVATPRAPRAHRVRWGAKFFLLMYTSAKGGPTNRGGGVTWYNLW